MPKPPKPPQPSRQSQALAPLFESPYRDRDPNPKQPPTILDVAAARARVLLNRRLLFPLLLVLIFLVIYNHDHGVSGAISSL